MLLLPEAWVWDFWLVSADEAPDHRYHLFFLYASRALHDPRRRHGRAGIGHAASPDLVNWVRLPDALVRGDRPAFDDQATWTGSVVRGPDGTWFMFYTGVSDADSGLVQRIGLATSTDLLRWDKHPANPLLEADPQWYEKLAEPPLWNDEAWRDPWVFADPGGDGWHMLITARANHGPSDDRGVIGHARSADLVHWLVQPPLSEPGDGFGQLEVFQLLEIDGEFLLIFNCLEGELSDARQTRTGGTGGVWVAAGQSAMGPFDIAGATLLADSRHYVGKAIKDPAGDWVLLAFENDDRDGNFVGSLTDPMPLTVGNRTLELADADRAWTNFAQLGRE